MFGCDVQISAVHSSTGCYTWSDDAVGDCWNLSQECGTSVMVKVNVLGTTSLSSTTVSFADQQQYSALNTGDFKLTVTTTSTDDSYPRSYCPLFFTSNPANGLAETGFSMGAGRAKDYLYVRMADGGKAIQKKFNYPYLSLNTRNTFELQCTKTISARVCSVAVNGVASSSGAQTFACSGNIYNGDGGLFGNTWGWKFIGTLHSVTFEAQMCDAPSAQKPPAAG
jgi:hypothetical protein